MFQSHHNYSKTSERLILDAAGRASLTGLQSWTHAIRETGMHDSPLPMTTATLEHTTPALPGRTIPRGRVCILDAVSAAGIMLRSVRGTQERGKRPEPLTRIAKTLRWHNRVAELRSRPGLHGGGFSHGLPHPTRCGKVTPTMGKGNVVCRATWSQRTASCGSPGQVSPARSRHQ